MADLAVYFEHPAWFLPLFAVLDRRGVAWREIPIASHVFDPADARPPAPVVLNRLAMSSFLRQSEHATFYTQALLARWRDSGARVINGPEALTVDASKARQLGLINALGYQTPATRVVHRVEDIVPASEGLRFPVVAKPNIGGSGTGVVKCETREELEAAVADGRAALGVDGVALVQEYVPARGGVVVRAETLNGKLLYAITLTTGDTFDLCPADVCRIGDDKPVVTMTETHLDAATTQAVERIARASNLDVGGIEFMIDDRDGTMRFYDINALSNFVADPMTVLGWDPHEKLVDYLIGEVEQTRRAAA